MFSHNISVWTIVVLLATSAHAQDAGQTTATGTSNSFNPAISVNGLFLGYHTSDPFALEPAFGHEAHEEEGEDHATETEEEHHEEGGHAHGLPEEGGLSVQEFEIRMSANVDAYFRADVTLAIPGTEGVELEEGYLETIGLPNVTLRAGKFFSSFGKHNALHTHAFPFVDGPIAQERILGGEGLNEIGVRASLLLPASWFSELDVELLDGTNELYNSSGSSDYVYAASWRNLWDLTDESTFEIAGSAGTGKNEADAFTQIYGLDATYKWRASRGSQRSVIAQIEYLRAHLDDGTDTEKAGGLSTHLMLQTSRAWWIQGRYDLFGIPNPETDKQHRYSALVGLVPSEFSSFRLQYSLNKEGDETVHQFAFQINFTMGSHPAHAY